MKILNKNTKIFFLIITFFVVSTLDCVNACGVCPKSKKEVKAQWDTKEQDKISKWLTKQNYKQASEKLKKFIEQKNPLIINWLLEQSTDPLIQYLLIEYYYNCHKNKLLKTEELQEVAKLIILNVILAYDNITWILYTGQEDNIEAAFKNLNDLLSIYSKWFLDLLANNNKVNYQDSLKKAKDSLKDEAKLEAFVKPHPAWICSLIKKNNSIDFTDIGSKSHLIIAGGELETTITAKKLANLAERIKWAEDRKDWKEFLKPIQ
jgi:hypothetical protein